LFLLNGLYLGYLLLDRMLFLHSLFLFWFQAEYVDGLDTGFQHMLRVANGELMPAEFRAPLR